MFERAVERAGGTATLHALRHTAAYRMAEDPALPLTDVQLVLGHALLSTTQIYLTPRKEEVIRRVLAHHAEQTRQAAERDAPTACARVPARDAGGAVREPDAMTESDVLTSRRVSGCVVSSVQGPAGVGAHPVSPASGGHGLACHPA